MAPDLAEPYRMTRCGLAARKDGAEQQRGLNRAAGRFDPIAVVPLDRYWITSSAVANSVTAYQSSDGEVEARIPPRYAASIPHAVTNFRE
jgi:hypothetical protein